MYDIFASTASIDSADFRYFSPFHVLKLKATEWILTNMYLNQFMWHAGKLAFSVLSVNKFGEALCARTFLSLFIFQQNQVEIHVIKNS